MAKSVLDKCFALRVVKFDEYNSKAKGKSNTWFRVDARLARSPKYSALSAGAKLLWLWVLCESAQSTSRVVYVSPRDVSRDIHVKPGRVPMVISELSSIEWIQVLETPYERTNKTNEQDERTFAAGSQRPPPPTPEVPALIPQTASKKPKPDPEVNRPTWEAFKAAYVERYKVEPIRNQKANVAIANFVKRIGAEDAPDIIRFFVWHNGSFYVRQMHDVGLALKDAEALRTQWLKGRAITESDVRRFEKNNEHQSLLDLIDKEGV